jgi:hypothetical protein
MGGEESGAVGESPSFHAIGPGGIPIKKKVGPKASPKKLTEKKGWKKSFEKYAGRSGGKKI